jgi:hypothetical protein
MQGTVANTFVYPIKGFHGVATPKRGLLMDLARGVVGDREFAVHRRPNVDIKKWLPKGMFHVCMNTAGMAVPHDITEEDLHPELWNVDFDQAEKLIESRGFIDEKTSLCFSAGGWRMTDTDKPYVSFLNLSSVRELSNYVGVDVDPRRFRMNVWVDGLPPFFELDFIKEFENGDAYPMVAGRVRFGIDDVCERCRAIEQNPETGMFDINLLDQLGSMLRSRGYHGSPHRKKHEVMGWLAIPKDVNLIRIGDVVTFG